MSDRIRVALIIGQLHAGGSERQLYELVTRLKGGRCEPRVYCLSQVVEPLGPKISAAGVPLTVIPRRRSYELRRMLELANHFEQDRIDVVHSLSLGANLYSYLALLKSTRRPFLTSNRATDDTCSWVVSHIHRQVMLRSQLVIVNSQAGRRFTTRFFRLPEGKVQVIPNGIDLARFDNPSPAAATRAGLGIAPSAPVVGIVGRLSPEKGLDLFLKMAQRVARERVEARFLVVGEGPLRPELEARARARGLGEFVLFTGNRDDVPDLMAAMDILTLTSSQEGLPNTVLEAMAAGRPVVATDVGGCRELITPGVSGYLSPSGDERSLADRVLEVLALSDRGSSLGMAGRAKVEAEHEVATMVRRFEEAYCRLHRERQ